MRNRILGVSSAVFILGLVSFITDTSSEIMNPLLPIFITLLGGGGIAVGIVSALSESISSFLKVYSGHIADKTEEHKKLAFFGYLISSLSKLAIPFSTHWSMVAASKSVERIGKGVRTSPRDALIAKVSAETVRGKAFGLHRAMDTLGAVAGSLLCLLLLIYFGEENFGLESIRNIILIGAIISFFALPPFIFLKVSKGIPSKRTLRMKMRSMDQRFRLFLVSVSLFALGNINYMFFILRVYEKGNDFYSVILSIIFYIVFNISYALIAYPAGKISDKIGSFPILMIAYITTCVSFLIIGVSASTPSLLVSFILYGLGFGTSDTLQRKVVSLFPVEKGFAMGMYHTIYGISVLFGGVMWGFLWEIKPTLTFLFGSFLVGTAAIVLSIVQKIEMFK